MTTSPAFEVRLEALCEAQTRVGSLFDGKFPVVDELPHDNKPKPAKTIAAESRAVFFKNQAPNH
jgi:hypothetical protein